MIAGTGAPTALVTGATSGIGKEVGRQLAEAGWQVLVGARDVGRGRDVATEVGGRALALDVTDATSVAGAAAEVVELDVLVNNAGISLDTGSVVAEVEIDVFPAPTRPTCSASWS